MINLPTPVPFGLPSDTGGKDMGVFMPMANGGWILSRNAPRLDGSYDYNRKVAVAAEAAGLDFIMAMAKFKGYGGEIRQWESSLDSVLMMAALAEATSRVKVWATIHTILQNPGVAAKMIATLDQISHGRAGLNLVTGSYKGEFAQFGAWPEGVDHDGRYDLAYEWIRAIKRLWSEDRVTSHGTYFQLEDATSWPKPSHQPSPSVRARPARACSSRRTRWTRSSFPAAIRLSSAKPAASPRKPQRNRDATCAPIR
jgi:pyrimidine oxygenase